MATHDYVYDADDPEIQLKTTHPTKDQASSPITLDQSEKGSPRTTRARMEDEPSLGSPSLGKNKKSTETDDHWTTTTMQPDVITLQAQAPAPT